MARHEERCIAVSLREGVVIVDGELIPITHRFDLLGDEAESHADVTKVVAGPMRSGQWLATMVTDDERRAASVSQ